MKEQTLQNVRVQNLTVQGNLIVLFEKKFNKLHSAKECFVDDGKCVCGWSCGGIVPYKI